MSKKFQLNNMSKKQVENTIRGGVYALIFIIALFFSYMYWFSANLSLCGLSGCSGGGFGVSYDPEAVKDSLHKSGLVAAIAPLVIFFISKFKWWWLLVAVLTFLLVPILGAAVIGAGLDGYPIHRIR
jgi:hypothetical protein